MNTTHVAIHSRQDIVDVFRDISPNGMCGLEYADALCLAIKVIDEVKTTMDPATGRAERSYEIARRMQEAKKALLQ